jgi:hypothetical protein
MDSPRPNSTTLKTKSLTQGPVENIHDPNHSSDPNRNFCIRWTLLSWLLPVMKKKGMRVPESWDANKEHWRQEF